MKLKDYIQTNPDFTFNMLPILIEEGKYKVDVKNEDGLVVKTFIYNKKEDANKETDEAVDVAGIDKIKRQLLIRAQELLQSAGINPEEIWRTSFFAIDDFLLAPGVSCKKAALLVEKIEKDAEDVVYGLGKCMTNGLLFDWTTVAETAVDEIASRRIY